MRVFKPLLMMLCLGVFVLSAPLGARADDWNKETTLTFNKPLEVPGMVLAPGTYVFRLLDSASDRNVVQIFNADESHLYENVLAIPAYRLEPTDKTVVTFEERAKGSPEAISTWFYPGDNTGEEFVYAPINTTAVASLAAEKAVSTSGKTSAAAPQTRSKPTLTEQQTNLPTTTGSQTAAAPVTTKEPVQVAQAATQPQPAVSPTATAAPAASQKQIRKKLPKTASPVPALILIGLLSLAGSAGAHVFSNRPF
jgi:hypothetical protein